MTQDCGNCGYYGSPSLLLRSTRTLSYWLSGVYKRMLAGRVPLGGALEDVLDAGRGYHFNHNHHSHLLGNSSLRHPNLVAGFNLPEGLCFQQRRCVVIIHRPTGGDSNGWPVNNDKHNNAVEHASR